MRRFEALEPLLNEHQITVVALSKDSVEDAARHKARDNLTCKLLSDPDLKVIRQFGVEHHKAVEFSTLNISIFGVHFGLLPQVKAMAIPTTLLLDEAGVVRWIDQADDYRIRSDGSRVGAAVQQTFGTSKG